MNHARLIRDFTIRCHELDVFAGVEIGQAATKRIRGYPRLQVHPTQWAARPSVTTHGVTVSQLSAQAIVTTADHRSTLTPDLDAHEALRTAIFDAAAYAATQQSGVSAKVTFGRYAFASSRYPEWRETISIRWVENDDGGTIPVPPD